MTSDDSGKNAEQVTPEDSGKKSTKKKSPREKLIEELGRRLVLTDDFVNGKTPETPEGTEYGVIIYYNGSVKPNV